jgi:hypothetical protein
MGEEGKYAEVKMTILHKGTQYEISPIIHAYKDGRYSACIIVKWNINGEILEQELNTDSKKFNDEDEARQYFEATGTNWVEENRSVL